MHQSQLRITPAYAGKRRTQNGKDTPRWDHPRVCGEKPLDHAPHLSAQGSPPRMRGKGPLSTHGTRGLGITPAYAGKRNPPRRNRPARQDHPRVCGEKLLCCMRWLTGRGSPPRMRGKDLLVATPGQKQPGSPPRMRGKAEAGLVQRELPGITPAYAGKSALAIDE